MVDVLQAVARRELRERSQEALVDWIAALRPWPYFATLTYDPIKIAAARGFAVERGAVVDPTGSRLYVGLSKMRRDVKRFIVDAGGALDGVDLVCGIEPHESGSLHAHALINPVRGAQMGDKVALHDAWYQRHGFIKVDDVEAVGGAAFYVAKFERVAAYALKSQGDFVFSDSLRRT